MHNLTDVELSDLAAAFRDLLNYASDDPTAPIDPLTYSAPDGDTCLHIAARRGDAQSVRLLLKAGLDVNALGDMGTTPLHCAKTDEIVSLLLAAGASTDIRDAFGRVPLEKQVK